MRYYDERARGQWELISGAADFEGKIVVDLGCGEGDLAIVAASEGGAKICHGIDEDETAIDKCRRRAAYYRGKGADWERGVFFSRVALDGSWRPATYYDIGICLPATTYFRQPRALLYMMQEFCAVSLIEVQYGGGPGAPDRDEEARKLFKRIGWESAERIGETGRGAVVWKLI